MNMSFGFLQDKIVISVDSQNSFRICGRSENFMTEVGDKSTTYLLNITIKLPYRQQIVVGSNKFSGCSDYTSLKTGYRKPQKRYF